MGEKVDKIKSLPKLRKPKNLQNQNFIIKHIYINLNLLLQALKTKKKNIVVR